MALSDAIFKIIPYKRKPKAGGQSLTSTYNPSSTQTALSAPTYRDHIEDIFNDRISLDSQDLLKKLFKGDPDVSATLGAFLTLADTKYKFYVYDSEGAFDREGQKLLFKVFKAMEFSRDYGQGFVFTPSIQSIAEQCRYMLLLRGAISAELIFDKFLLPVDIRQIDMKDIDWYEQKPGVYKPKQSSTTSNTTIDLDIPNFFVKYYRQNPTEIYPTSPFVASINTIAARQQVINDLYRIMQKTGYPRLDVEVIEEVLIKNAPANVRADVKLLSAWKADRMREIATSVSTMRPDAAYVHTDSVKPTILNEGGPRNAMDVTAIIDVLNAQNQAALKTMATIIGRGSAGVNTASVEARVFSMSADSLNVPIADLLSDMFTFALRLQGFEGYVEFEFDKVELRPQTELEPQLVLKQSRLLKDLSLGIISDEQYSIEMYGTLPREGAPILSGTGFFDAKSVGQTQEVSPNSDPLGRSTAPEGSSQARSKGVK